MKKSYNVLLRIYTSIFRKLQVCSKTLKLRISGLQTYEHESGYKKRLPVFIEGPTGRLCQNSPVIPNFKVREPIYNLAKSMSGPYDRISYKNFSPKSVLPRLKTPRNLISKSTVEIKMFVKIDVQTLNSTSNEFSVTKFAFSRLRVFSKFSFSKKKIVRHIGKSMLPKFSCFTCEMGPKIKKGEPKRGLKIDWWHVFFENVKSPRY